MRNRQGISLVEVIVAMTLLAVILTSLAGLTVQAARTTTSVAANGYRQGVMMQEVNRLTALPWPDLPGAAGCRTVAGGTFPYTRCTVVTDLSNTKRRLTVMVTPAQRGVPADTVVFERSRPPALNPLSMS